MLVESNEISDWLRRRINTARAESGMSWSQIAEVLSTPEAVVSPSSLMSKHSRSSFTAVELVAILRVMGVSEVRLPEVQRAS
jgi:hypothetical protein